MRRWRVAAAAGLLMAVPASMSLAQAVDPNPEYQLTDDVRRGAEEARAAIAVNNFPAASAALSQAAAAARTDGDRYVVTTLQLDVANRTFNRQAQVAAIDALLGNPLVGEEEKARLHYHRARFAYHAQDIRAARTALEEAVRGGATNPRTYIALADLEAESGNHGRALELFDRAATIERESGAPVPEAWLRRAVDLAHRLGDVARTTELMQRLLAGYPSQRNWRDTLSFYRTIAQPDPAAQLDLWRLQAATGALTGEADYLAYARLANTERQPGEVQRLIEQGRAVSMLDGGNSELSSLLTSAQRAATTASGRLEGQATAARSAANGADALSVANDYLAFGQYPEAAALYATAIEKGGIDAELANLRRGIALAMAGDAEGARTALAAVTGNRGWIARFWRIYVDTRPPPTPPTPPSPPESG